MYEKDWKKLGRGDSKKNDIGLLWTGKMTVARARIHPVVISQFPLQRLGNLHFLIAQLSPHSPSSPPTLDSSLLACALSAPMRRLDFFSLSKVHG